MFNVAAKVFEIAHVACITFLLDGAALNHPGCFEEGPAPPPAPDHEQSGGKEASGGWRDWQLCVNLMCFAC